MIYFGVWSPDEATFWQSWTDAGICSSPGVFAPEYSGVEVSASWSGKIVKTPAVLDAQGNVTTPAVVVPGWHCNARVTGPLVAAMTYQLPQTDADGVLLPLFDRTWAAQIFQLTDQPADSVTGFPAGMRNAAGVTYCDPAEFESPSNVWA